MPHKNNLFEHIAAGENILSMEHITKIYSNGFVANKDVNFSVCKGEIHGLVGENGAGKTTLMKVLFGQEIPEEGQIILGGAESKINGPLTALQYGIGMVHQHFMLVQSLTVAENLVLGHEPTRGPLFNKDEAVRLATEISEQYDLAVDPNAVVRDLSVGGKQRVEILKMLLQGASILLLDEPTAVLTPQETKELFIQLKNLKAKGFSVVFISHKLNEVKEICDRITVLRNGQSVGTVDIGQVSEMDISKMMVGRDVSLSIDKAPAQPGKTVLKVRNLSHINKFGHYSFRNLSFDVRNGEILGVAGVEGNGQSELSDTLSGLLPIQQGDADICGVAIKEHPIRAIRELGAAFIHEDRMAYGASSNQSIAENIIPDRYHKPEYQRYCVLKLKHITQKTKALIESFSIKCDSYLSKIRTLSGGNIQKVVAAREFSSSPKLLVASHPTRGIDIGATELIRTKMVALRDEERTAILLFSADLTELLSISDSIFVMFKGEIVAYFPDVSRIDEQTLGEYMLGIKRQDEVEIGRAVYEG